MHFIYQPKIGFVLSEKRILKRAMPRDFPAWHKTLGRILITEVYLLFFKDHIWAEKFILGPKTAFLCMQAGRLKSDTPPRRV